MEQSRRLSKITEETVVDKKTGNKETNTTRKTFWLKQEPEYVKLYLRDCCYLKSIPKGLNSVLYSLIMIMDYNNRVVVNSFIKRQIAEDNGISFDMVNGALTKFVKAQLLTRLGVGTYQVNPFIFGKGSWDDIESIRMVVEYTVEGRTFESFFTTKEEKVLQD